MYTSVHLHGDKRSILHTNILSHIDGDRQTEIEKDREKVTELKRQIW